MRSPKEIALDQKIIDAVARLDQTGRVTEAARLILKDDEIQSLQEYANIVSIKRLGYNDHGPVHMRTVAYNVVIMMGLWLLQECMRVWKSQGKDYSFAELAQKAEATGYINAFIDPDDESFFEPQDMPGAVAKACVQNGYAPQSDVELVRIITQSLACKYRYVAQQAQRLTGREFDTLYLFGGGSNNGFLNKLTADITGKTVLAGLPNATAAGNILTQWIGRGLIKDLSAARVICKNSHRLKEFKPSGTNGQEMYQSFLKITNP